MISNVEYWKLDLTLRNDEGWGEDEVWEIIDEAMKKVGLNHSVVVGEPEALKLVPVEDPTTPEHDPHRKCALYFNECPSYSCVPDCPGRPQNDLEKEVHG